MIVYNIIQRTMYHEYNLQEDECSMGFFIAGTRPIDEEMINESELSYAQLSNELAHSIF